MRETVYDQLHQRGGRGEDGRFWALERFGACWRRVVARSSGKTMALPTAELVPQ